MGLFKGLVGIATSPITLVQKTVSRVVDKDCEIEDVLTLGLTKVVKGLQDTAEEIDEDFDA